MMIRYSVPRSIELRRTSLRRSITNPFKDFAWITRCMLNFRIQLPFFGGYYMHCDLTQLSLLLDASVVSLEYGVFSVIQDSGILPWLNLKVSFTHRDVLRLKVFGICLHFLIRIRFLFIANLAIKTRLKNLIIFLLEQHKYGTSRSIPHWVNGQRVRRGVSFFKCCLGIMVNFQHLLLFCYL